MSVNSLERLAEMLSDFFTSRSQVLTFALILFFIGFLFSVGLKRFLGSLNIDSIGFKILEDQGANLLVRIRHPGNLRYLDRELNVNKNIILKFSKMKKFEFDYAIFLLKSLAYSRRATAYKIEKNLFIMKPQGYAEKENGKSPPDILDFEGNIATFP